jgi:thymidylate synthase (FAD)
MKSNQANPARPKSEDRAATAIAHSTRPTVVALDELVGVQLRVLDDGFIRLVDYMGDDSAVVQAARVSYGAGTKRVQDDRSLIRYLMRHSHTTPFEMCEIKFHVRAPMDVWRQWIRHRTANVNEYSTRYSVAIDAAQRTAPSEWRLQSPENKQGSEGFLPEAEGEQLSTSEAETQIAARKLYEKRLTMGVAREQARKDLPLSTYTEAYWKIDLHNLLHFLKLRMDSRAQEEIRKYAIVMGEQIVSKWVPFVWEAFLDYQCNDLHLSRTEREVLAALIAGLPERARVIAESNGLLKLGKDGVLTRNREREELEAKLRGLGFSLPW